VAKKRVFHICVLKLNLASISGCEMQGQKNPARKSNTRGAPPAQRAGLAQKGHKYAYEQHVPALQR